jgi:hypothetical protein
MTKDEIIRMAREAGFDVGTEDGYAFVFDFNNLNQTPRLERFAALAAAAEREACAKVCDSEAKRALFNWSDDLVANQVFWNGAEQVASGCAESIRSRNETM